MSSTTHETVREPVSNLSPEQSFWQKYNSKHEFPISFLSSVTLHFLVIFGIIGFLAFKIIWGFDSGNKPNPDPVYITTEEPGGSPRGDQGADTETVPGRMNNSVEFEPVEPLNFDPFNIEKAKPENSNSKEFNKNAQELRQPGRPDGRGGEGDTPGRIKGPGSGDHGQRTSRWIIQFKFDDPDAYLSKLKELNAVLFAQMEENKFLVFEDLSQPSVTKTETKEGISQRAKKLDRLYYVSRSGTSCQAFAEAVHLQYLPRMLIIFIPRELEQQMLKAELAHAGVNEGEIIKRNLKTTFDISRHGDHYQVKVTGQK